MEKEIESAIEKNGLTEEVKLLGMMKPEEVRNHMKTADIFLITSDYKEGWGAVCNEAMNEGCVVVASHAAGAVPTLIKHRVNGMIFPSGDFAKMAFQIEELSKDQKWRLSLGENAYETLENGWNHVTAAERLLKLSEAIMEDKPFFYEKGPLSEAKVIPERKMYRKVIGIEQ